jgi:hypothetical protein
MANPARRRHYIDLAAAISESARALELIVLLDERSKIGKAKHHDEHDQQADGAEQHDRNQIRVDVRCCFGPPQSMVVPFLVLMATSIATWTIVTAIHGMK